MQNTAPLYYAFVAILSVLALKTTCLGQEPKNLIPNPGFELGTGEDPIGWRKDVGVNRGVTDWAAPQVDTQSKRSYRMGVDTDDFYSGKSSYTISNVWSYVGQMTGVLVAEPIRIEAGNRYLLSFWYKTKDIREYAIPLIVETVVARREHADPVITDKRVPVSAEWSHYYVLLENLPPDAKDLTIGFYNWFRTKGSISLDDISLTKATDQDVANFEHWRRQTAPSVETGSNKPQILGTGFYRVECSGGRWSLVDPNGKAVWAASILGEVPLAGENERAPKTARRPSPYGTTAEAAARNMYQAYLNLGFTAFAGWTDARFAKLTDERYDRGEPYMGMVKVLGLVTAGGESVKVRDRNGVVPAKDNRLMVDPFNPAWQKAAREMAMEKMMPYKGKHWFLGWFVDNEMFYEDLFRYVWAEYSAKEFRQLLEQKYGEIGALNRAWTSAYAKYDYRSFDDILIDKPEPKGWGDPLLVDFTLIERRMIAAYVDYTYKLVKELDPDHLIISNRFHWRAMPNLYRHIDLWKGYDIIAINIYPNNNVIGYDSGERAVLEWLHQGTGRPMIIGEWSVPALDSGLYNYGPDSLGRPIDWSWHQLVRTQKERGEIYETCVQQLVDTGFMVGAGWFTTVDFDSTTRRSNRGFMNSDYEMYRDLTGPMQRINEKINR